MKPRVARSKNRVQFIVAQFEDGKRVKQRSIGVVDLAYEDALKEVLKLVESVTGTKNVAPSNHSLGATRRKKN